MVQRLGLCFHCQGLSAIPGQDPVSTQCTKNKQIGLTEGSEMGSEVMVGARDPITWTLGLHSQFLRGPQALQRVSPATRLGLVLLPLCAGTSPVRPQLQAGCAWIPTGEEASPRCCQTHRPGRLGSAAPTSCRGWENLRGPKGLEGPPQKLPGGSGPADPPSAARLAQSAAGLEVSLGAVGPEAVPGAGGGGVQRAGPGGR